MKNQLLKTFLGNRVIQKLIFPFTMLIIFWSIAIAMYISLDNIFWLFNFGYLGIALGFGLALYSLLPRRKKPIGRKIAQFLIGLYMLCFLGLFMSENMQIEGFFFYAFSGVFSGALIHYLVAKILGPFFFSRGWCSWACWTAMVLDLLPFSKNNGWMKGKLRWIRFGMFFLSFGIVTLLWFLVNYREQARTDALWWLLGGNLLYYGVGISMAYIYKDNRAFCKYICPVAVPLKFTSRFSLVKIAGDAEKCTSCSVCTKNCPMSINIPEYVLNNQRILSTECTLCQTCISVCSSESLKLSFDIDLGGKESLIEYTN
jgi:ferredoxin-type protein NapH